MGTDAQYEMLKQSLNDDRCHVYEKCTFPSWLKAGTLKFLDYTDMKVFLRSLTYLY